MIRHATLDDLPSLMPLAQEFYEASGLGLESPYDGPRVSEIFGQMIAGESSEIIVAEFDGQIGGMIGLVSAPDLWAGGVVVQEVFWWIDPAFRGRRIGRKLLKAAEQWAEELKANTMVMVVLNSTSPAALHSVYSRAGYEPVETHYRKAL